LFIVATSDHQVSSRRSSNGKSNSVASISVVSSIDTLSTQSKGSLRGRLSSTRCRCARGSAAPLFARLAGATMVLTALRWSSCLGGSIAMNIGSRSPSGALNSVMPPCVQSDENSAGWVSTNMMSW
jgi:hypothetical protein